MCPCKYNKVENSNLSKQVVLWFTVTWTIASLHAVLGKRLNFKSDVKLHAVLAVPPTYIILYTLFSIYGVNIRKECVLLTSMYDSKPQIALLRHICC